MATIYDTGLIYDTGVIYPLETTFVLHYRANPYSDEAVDTDFILLRHIQCRVKHSEPSLFQLRNTRLHVQVLKRTFPQYRAVVNARGYQRLSVRMKHDNNTNFQLFEMRAYAKVTKGRSPTYG